MFSKIISISCLSLAVLSFISTPVLASNVNEDLKINKSLKNEIQQKLQKIKNADPQKPDFHKINYLNDNESNSVQNDIKLNINLKQKTIKLENKYKGNTNISIPKIANLDSVDLINDKIIYSGKHSKADVIVESIDGGIRQIINIKSSDAPSFYDFPTSLESGEKMELTNEGTVIIKRLDNTSKMTILKPWAKDSKGKILNTWYQVVGENLRQHIDLNKAVFPVVADPIWCGDAIQSVIWISRNNTWSASIKPTWCGASLGTGSWSEWEEFINKTPNSWQWDKKYGTRQYWSMYNQFYCHVWYAGWWKTPWNIEPATPYKSYYDFVKNACN